MEQKTIQFDRIYDNVECLNDKKQVQMLFSLCDYMLCEKFGPGKYASPITTAEDAYGRLSWMRFEEQENIVLVTLDSANHIIKIHKLVTGLVNEAPFHPREGFRKAIEDNAVSVMFAHNHPSGNNEPSEQDLAITRVMVAAGKILKIPVLDHIIVAKGGNRSLLRCYPELFEEIHS